MQKWQRILEKQREAKYDTQVFDVLFLIKIGS